MPKTKQQKQEEATDRQRLRNARTNQQQLNNLQVRPGLSVKEIKRLAPSVVPLNPEQMDQWNQLVEETIPKP